MGITSPRSEEHTSELQSLRHLVCRLLLEKKKSIQSRTTAPGGVSVGCGPWLLRARWVDGAECGQCTAVGVVPTRVLAVAFFFFFNDTATPEFYLLPLHDALPF